MAQQAKIIVLGENDAESSQIEVSFNPDEYVLKHETAYKNREIAGTDTVITQFLHGTPSVLEVSLLFDEDEKITTSGREDAQDVSGKIDLFIKLIYIDAALHRPPHIKFQWGSLDFKGVVLRAETRYTRFDNEGMPTRGTVDLTVKEVLNVQTSARKTPFESPDRTKCRMITAGKNLWNIAYDEYGAMDYWRVIAAENELLNPLELKPGQMLKIPAI